MNLSNIKAIAASPDRLRPWQRPNPGKTTIGVVAPCYGSSHVIFGLDTPHYQHRHLSTLPLRKFDRGGTTFFQYSPYVFRASVPLVHTFNAIPLNGDFVVSHELELPRYLGDASDRALRFGMRMLADDRCKNILAMSEFARNFVLRRFERFGFGHLASKMEVFRGMIPDANPPGGRVSRANRVSFTEKPLSAVVVGTQLFRKGGMTALLAFERLRARGLNVQLTLIGRFEPNCYAFGKCTPNPSEWTARARGHSWVRFLDPIPNAQVFQELHAHDLCIYTSLDESLGWLPIEAGMLGLPVIATRVCALPELVGDRTTGWLVDIPLREDGRWSAIELEGPSKQAAVDDAVERIVVGTEACLLAVHDQPELLEQWSAEGYRRTTALYGIEPASRQLERIYDEALGVV